jgi:AcrR family transcriptional regulator
MAQPRNAAQRSTAPKVPRKSSVSKESSGQLDGGRARDREVIEAAVEIFWEKGYANASVQDVADRLGMLKGSLYYYINSKESLLVKIFDDSHAEIKDITDVAMASEGSALERLARYLTNYALWTLTHIKRAGLYSREWRYASADLRSSLDQHSRYYNRSLRSLIVSCQEEGSIPLAVDVRVAPLFIWSAFTALPDWFNPERDSVNVVADRYVVMALGALSVTNLPDLTLKSEVPASTPTATRTRKPRA